ncbi:cation diffusion facilitator family transporter [Paraburkholderia sp. UCT31]|uniref:cation diffusion facilitator family transporter n=1 Tax=Paraburkholderia sp. UCT31 TaxID=2615209 RepID=UPI001655C7BE|nr:cation diffusion facilitator family transporter [Paraburkholderia sp. UCT31]MBC8740421.1 cation diffusion facilitator family transporter [Paraburkholderia sp. UCT31]
MSQSLDGGPRRAVQTALAANLGIALAKCTAAAFTMSGTLLAESLHSFCDCANQLLLLTGMRHSQAPATDKHPMGAGKAIYFYAALVAIFLFFGGGLFSVFTAYQHFLNPTALEHGGLSLAVLVVAALLEGYSLSSALRGLKKERGKRTLYQWFRESRSSELLIVTGEDIGALVGLGIAVVALLLTIVTGNPLFDAAGALCVGLLLMGISSLLLREIRDLIIGESASAETRKALADFLAHQDEVKEVVRVTTLQWGREIAVTVKAEMHERSSASLLIAAVDALERRLRAQFPAVRWVSVQPGHAQGIPPSAKR